MKQLSPGVYRWTTRHPEYRTSVEEVASYAVTAPEGLALVDPLLPDGPTGEALLAQLDGLVGSAPRIDVLITIPYHTRSAERLWWGWHETVETRIWGHPAVGKRFKDPLTPLEHIDAGAPAGPLARALAIGRPRRSETPLYFPALRALAFGDAVVGMPDGSLRIWVEGRVEPTWYNERFLPTLQPLLDLDVAHVLVTHGPAVIGDARHALRAALEAPPVTKYW
jgi:hypothetical protein